MINEKKLKKEIDSISKKLKSFDDAKREYFESIKDSNPNILSIFDVKEGMIISIKNIYTCRYYKGIVLSNSDDPESPSYMLSYAVYNDKNINLIKKMGCNEFMKKYLFSSNSKHTSLDYDTFVIYHGMIEKEK